MPSALACFDRWILLTSLSFLRNDFRQCLRSCFFAFRRRYKSESSLLPDSWNIGPTEKWEIAFKLRVKIVSNSLRKSPEMFTSLHLYLVTALFAMACGVSGIVTASEFWLLTTRSHAVVYECIREGASYHDEFLLWKTQRPKLSF